MPCRRYLGVDILAALDVANLTDTFKARGWHFSESDSWDELFHRLWVGQVEPKLNAEHPVYFLTEYPAPLAALARRSVLDPRVAERAECVVSGLELSNGFGELHDPHEQRMRFESDRNTRAELGKATPPLDEEFLNSRQRSRRCVWKCLGYRATHDAAERCHRYPGRPPLYSVQDLGRQPIANLGQLS